MLKLRHPFANIAASAALLFLFLCSGVAGQGTENDWPQFLGPDRNGISTEKDILTDWSDNKLKTVWKLDVAEGYAIGSVAGGKYFHFDVAERKGEEGEEEGNVARLRSIDMETGNTDWTFTAPSGYKDIYGYDSGPRTSPLIHDGRVYCYGVEGMLWCIDQSSGDLIWEINTIEKFGVIQNFFGVCSCPLIHEDLLITMVGGSPEESKEVPRGRLNRVKPNGSAIVAFNRKSGEEVYRMGDDLASYSSMRLAEIHGQKIVLAWMREKLLAFRPESGKLLFSFPWRARKLESVNAATPVVSGNRIFIGESYQKGGVLLNVKTPDKPESDEPWETEIVWTDDGKRNKSMAPHWNTPVLVDGFMYGCDGEKLATAKLRCVEFETGVVKWSVPQMGRSSVTWCDGYLVVMTEVGKLLLVKSNPEKYELVTEYDGDVKFRRRCWAAPVIANGKLIVRGLHVVACFDLKPND